MKMDTKQVDLLALIGRDTDLKKAASTGGGEWHGSCPFCGGTDRFAVQPFGKGWSCRQCTPNWQDAIEYVMRRDNKGFKEAVAMLGIPLDSQPHKSNRRTVTPDMPQPLATDKVALTDDEYQHSARSFCSDCFDALWSKDGAKVVEYLKQRGISEAVIERYGLGFNPDSVTMQWGSQEVYLSRGIVIPWIIGNKIWKVNIRRSTGDSKYLPAAGGANGLYNADVLEKDQTVVMVEGEFDALVLETCVKGITPVATGTTSGARVLRWVTALGMAGQVVVAYDADEDTNEGVKKAVQWWLDNLSNAVRLKPTAHDVTDMWKAGANLQQWLDAYSLYFMRAITPDEMEYRNLIESQFKEMGYARSN